MKPRLLPSLLALLALLPGAAQAIPMGDGVEVDENGVEIRYRPATEAERQSATTSIQSQLKAFRENNWDLASRFQSQGLQRNFASLDEFRSSIQRGYPQFAASRAVNFGHAICTADGSRLNILVTVEGADGVIVRAIYRMVREESGYAVSGVETRSNRRPQPQDIV